MNFLVFSDDWGAHPSSCQHIVRILARRHPTVWVNTVGMRPPRLSLGDGRKAYRKVRAMLSPPVGWQERLHGSAPGADEQERASITVCSPPMLPFHRLRPVLRWNSRSVERTVRRVLPADRIANACLVTTVPNVAGAVERIGARRVVYYCVDDFSEWPGMERDAILRMEAALLPLVDRIVCTSRALFERFKDRYPTWLLPHGVDLDLFRDAGGGLHPSLHDIPEPRVGYFGLLDGRTDDSLVASVASLMPSVAFVFTGPAEGNFTALRRLRNVHFTGPVPYRELPAVVRGWKACFLPYRLNALTEKIHPLKLKEYLATGKPVVASRLPEALELAEHVRFAADVEEWVRELSSAVNGDWTVDTEKVLEFLRDHTWNRKAEEFLEICAGA